VIWEDGQWLLKSPLSPDDLSHEEELPVHPAGPVRGAAPAGAGEEGRPPQEQHGQHEEQALPPRHHHAKLHLGSPPPGPSPTCLNLALRLYTSRRWTRSRPGEPGSPGAATRPGRPNLTVIPR
jgi:hypothetical protein